MWDDSLYFNVDEESLGTIPMCHIRGDSYFDTPWRYFGESQDRLHLIEICDPCKTHFSVYEMKKDYSEWFLKYSVDLDDLLTTFPEMTRSNPNSVYFDRYAFSILSLVRGEKDEESFLVLYIPGKAIRYNLVNRTFWKLCDIKAMTGKHSLDYNGWPDVYEYIESHASVSIRGETLRASKLETLKSFNRRDKRERKGEEAKVFEVEGARYFHP
ncbi:unnamed protein product [Ilex paraguariensis]|uniref:Uncharacterized protein n=1 Tax=Ilex paraguariensis TaxID=185542 RepID=A0ABC8V4D1_9AQUA